MPTILRQVLRKTFWRSRVLPQVPRHLPRRLRKLRRSLGICHDVCAGCASPAAFAETFARVAQVSRRLPWRLRVLPQVSRRLPWRLRESRKSRGKCFGVCGSPASLAANALAFAGVPRGISKDTLAVTTLYQRHSLGIKIPHSFVELTLGIILSCRGDHICSHMFYGYIALARASTPSAPGRLG